MARVICVGGAHMDIYAKPQTPLVAASSVPGAVTFRPGGVGRNLAVALARLGHQPVLLAALGTDAAGDWIQQDLSAAGVQLANLAAGRSEPTGAYVSLSDDAELAHAVADTRALDGVDPQRLLTALEASAPAELIIAECNLAVPLLQTLVDWCGRHRISLWIEPVSATKALRIAQIDGAVDLISPNALEARALSAALQRDNARGRGPEIRRWLVTRGADGVAYYDQHDHSGAAQLFAAVPTHPVNVHGAGDVLLATFAAAQLERRSVAASCHAAVRAAALAVACSEPVPTQLRLDELLPGSRAQA